MDTYVTVNEIKLAIRNAQDAVSHLHSVLYAISPSAIVPADQATVQKNADVRSCDLSPDKGPVPIHPGDAACWLHFPLSIEDVINPVESVGDIFRIMLTIFDAVNPSAQMPRRM